MEEPFPQKIQLKLTGFFVIKVTECKTIFARMQDIKNNKIDEDGLGINNVEIALKQVDIPLRDAQKNFRDFGVVLEDLSKKWDSIGETEKAYISKAIAGVRQVNMFTVLMQNMNKALDLQDKQLEATGLASDRYKIYLQGVEAAQNELKAATEAFYMDALDSGLIVSILKATTAILDFTRQILDLKSAIFLVVGAMVAFNAVSISSTINTISTSLTAGIGLWNALTTAIWGATAAETAFSAVTGIGIAIAVIGGLIAAFNYAAKAGERAQKAFDEATQSFKSFSDESKRTKAQLEDAKTLGSRYEELSKKINLTAEETQEYIDIQNKLNDIFPELSGVYDSELNFKIQSKNLSKEILELEKEKLKVLEEENRVKLKESAKASAELIIQTEKELKKDKQRLDFLKGIKQTKEPTWNPYGIPEEERTWNYSRIAVNPRELSELEEKVKNAQLALITLKKEFTSFYASLSASEKEAFALELDPSEANKQIQEWIKSVNWSDISSFYDEGNQEFLNNLEEKNKQALESIQATNDEIVALAETNAAQINKIFETSRKLSSGEAAKSDIDYLKEIGVQLDIVGGRYQVNQESLQKVTAGLYSATDAAKTMGYSITSSQEALYNGYVGTLKNASVAGVQWSAQMVQAVQGDLATMIWSSGLTLTDVNGNIMSSEGMVAQALASNAQNAILWLNAMQKAGILTLNVARAIGLSTQSYTQGITPYKPIFPSFGAGGGGGGGKSKEQDKIEKEIKRLEEKKKALKDLVDEYKKYIDTQKEILKNQKDEKEFTDELMKKNQSLAKLKSQIAILALDDSEEAKAKRIQLEEEAAELEQDITKSNEDRKYELQIKALEDAQKAYEDKMNAQIDMLDKEIEKLNETKGAISGGGGVSGAVTSLGSNFQNVFNSQILPSLKGFGDLTDKQKEKVMKLGEELYNQGLRTDELFTKIQNLVNFYNANAESIGIVTRAPGGGRTEIKRRHTGGFAGNLNSNEEFAKLLKGEYVATEGQMSNFMKNILPKIANYPSVSNVSNGGNISVSMPINVSGSLDDKVVPNIEKIAEKVVRQINDSMKSRGYIRATNHTCI